MDSIFTPNAPDPIGPYSQAIKTGNMLFCSGQIAIIPSSGKLAGEDIETQTRQICENIKSILKTTNMDFRDVVKAVCYLTCADDFKKFNDVYAEYFESSPARSCVFVSGLPKGAIVEIEVTANK